MDLLKRIFWGITAVVMLAYCVNITAFCSDDQQWNFTNLIVFAKFNGEQEFVNDLYSYKNDDESKKISVRKITDNSYNSAEFCVADYFKSVSNSRVRMKSLYLFDGDGSITLEKTRAYYAKGDDDNPEGYFDSGEQSLRMLHLKKDWSQAINAVIENGGKLTDWDGTGDYDFSQLDKNNDGKIDSITVIYAPTTQSNISVEWASPLWNYQDRASFVTINCGEKSVESDVYVQLTNSYNYLYTDGSDDAIIPIGVACHETGHIFGLLDLYKSSSNYPAGFMSAMSKHTTHTAQLISVKEKESLGWLSGRNIKEIKKSGTYKIAVSGDDIGDKTVGYKVDIPTADKTLYLEYRNFDGTGSKYDDQKKKLYGKDGSTVKGITLKSGLVCYIVNKGVQKPNSSNYSVLGGTNGQNKTDAALAVGDYEDIYDLFVEVTALDENELTFSLESDEFGETTDDEVTVNLHYGDGDAFASLKKPANTKINIMNEIASLSGDLPNIDSVHYKVAWATISGGTVDVVTDNEGNWLTGEAGESVDLYCYYTPQYIKVEYYQPDGVTTVCGDVFVKTGVDIIKNSPIGAVSVGSGGDKAFKCWRNITENSAVISGGYKVNSWRLDNCPNGNGGLVGFAESSFIQTTIKLKAVLGIPMSIIRAQNGVEKTTDEIINSELSMKDAMLSFKCASNGVLPSGEVDSAEVTLDGEKYKIDAEYKTLLGTLKILLILKNQAGV